MWSLGGTVSWHRDRRDLRALGRLVDEWEAEHGAFTFEELAHAQYTLDHPLEPAEILANVSHDDPEV
jgi:hypothetical protein